MTLTEQWKKGELESGTYYINVQNYDSLEVFEDIDYFFGGIGDNWAHYDNDQIIQVLAPVPSYEKWQEEQKSLKVLAEEYCKEKEENRQLKTKIAKLTEIVGVLPSNHSVGNLGYKIKNQRHEINNRLKEIDKLKELLKECREFFEEENPKDFTVMAERMDELLIKIDNAIGEKK